MSDDSNKSDKNGSSSLPDGIPAPPPPKPNIADPTQSGPTYGTTEKTGKKKKKGRNHPTDPYKPVKNKGGCKGCCGCLVGTGVVAVILLIAAAAALRFYGPMRHLSNGYELVQVEDPDATISIAPDKPTYYIGQKITYNAAATEVPIAILGTEIRIEGDFSDDVTITGAKVTGSSNANFAKDLEIWAAEFYDEGLFLNGELKGRVMKSLQ
ncbi:MAG: hypothetical protein CMO55_11685 [Verrucomicrobiales bacterium]|nr:hypothetical protein [Verrucomicrobiales bacterium]